MTKCLFWLKTTLFFLLFSATFSSVGKQIKFVWNAYCPYTCVSSEAGHHGYAMELVAAIFANSPYQIEYKFVDSWNRAMNMVKSGEADAIVFSFLGEHAEQNFVVPKQHLAIERGNGFIVLKSSHYQLTDINSLHQFNLIGVYKNTVWADKKLSEWERANRKKFTYLHGGGVFERALKMLRMNRIDAWEDSLGLLRYQVHKHNLVDVRIEKVMTDSVSEGGVLFSKKSAFAMEYAQFVSQGVLRLRRSGEFDAILAKYGQESFESQ